MATKKNKQNVVLQYGSKSVSYDELVERLKTKWTGDFGRKAADLTMTACGGKTSEKAESNTESVSGIPVSGTLQSEGVTVGSSLSESTGNSGKSDGTELVNSTSDVSTPTIQISGKKEGLHYENLLFNVFADFPNTYIVYSDEDLGQEYKDQLEIIQALAPGNVNYMDLVAQDSMTSENIQIMITHVDSLKDKGRSVDEWLDSSMDSFKKALIKQGATDLTADIVPLTFAGESVQAIQITCLISEKQIEQQFFYKTAEDYVMMIGVSAQQGRSSTLTGYFYGG